MRMQRYIFERIFHAFVRYESAAAKSNKPLLVIVEQAVQAIQNGEHIQIVPMPKFVPPEMEEHAEPESPLIRPGTPDYFATRFHVYPKDAFGKGLIGLALVANNAEDLEWVKTHPRWKQFVETGRKLEAYFAGGPVCEYTTAVRDTDVVIDTESRVEKKIRMAGQH